MDPNGAVVLLPSFPHPRGAMGAVTERGESKPRTAEVSNFVNYRAIIS